MKRVGLVGIIIFIVMIISVSSLSVTAFADGSIFCVLHDGVNLYSDTTLLEVAKELKQNDVVEVLESIQIGGEEYVEVQSGEIVGYVNANYIYKTSNEKGFELYTAKAYGKKVGGSIEVYATPSEKSSVVRNYLDGTVLTVSESDVEGYHAVIMDDGIGYVKSESITTSISYNGRVALAIALICVVSVVLILVITYYRRNSEYFKNKKGTK